MTGMPCWRALLIGETNAVASVTVVAIPGVLAVTAAWNEESMVEVVGWVDSAPVQGGVGRPSSAAQSAKPYWVGVKNELSVTWLMKVNFHLGVVGKLPAAALVCPAVLEEELLHAAISAEAAAVALNRPAPWSSRRRAGPSFMSS